MCGGAVYSPAITDFVFMVDKTSHMFITGPQVIKAVTGEDVSFDELGGARTHNTISGVAHFECPDEETCFSQLKQLISYLPENNLCDPEEIFTQDDINRLDSELNSIIPDDPNKPYDMYDIIKRVADGGEFFEIQAGFAEEHHYRFCTLRRKDCRIIANQPKVSAGALDVNASDKAARFIRFCDAFNIPLVTFTDVPGYLPGVNQEHNGIIRHGAKLLYAFL